MRIVSRRQGEHINITGGRLRTKFSIHEGASRYQATSAMGNSELVQFLDGLLGVGRDDGDYWWWEVPQNKVISTIAAVIDKFEV